MTDQEHMEAVWRAGRMINDRRKAPQVSPHCANGEACHVVFAVDGLPGEPPANEPPQS